MNFINPALLVGLGAVSIPIIIHLLNRRRFRVVRWAAMEFLLQANRQNRRRVRIEHLLVLLLRCLIVALIVLVMARPLSTSAGLAMLPGVVDPVERIVVLDDSGSMAHRTGRTSSFERAKLSIKGLVRDLRETRPRDFLTVVRVSKPKTPDLTLASPGDERTDAYVRGLEALEPSQRVFDVPSVLSHVLDVDEERAERRLVVYVLTDMRTRDWIGEGGALPEKIAEVMQGAPEGSRVVVVDVGGEGQQNLGVVSFRPTEKLAQAGVPLEVEVRVRNYGANVVADIPVNLESGDGRLPIAPLGVINPGEEAVVRHRYTFPQAGGGALTVHLPEDSLPMDDSSQLAVEVEDQLRVLLVDGEDSQSVLQSETGMLRLALAPPGDQNWGVEPVVVLPHELNDEDLSEYSAIVICNLDRWPEDRLGDLERFVSRGGGLAIMLGSRVEVDFYDDLLYTKSGLLPCKLGQRIEHPTPDDAPGILPPAEGVHPLTKILEGENNPFLKRVRTRVHMTLPLDTDRDATSKVLLQIDDPSQTPFLVEKPVGKGTVLLFNTTADLEWSTWARDPSFPIIGLEMTRLLAPRSTEGRNLRCGEELLRPINPARIVPTASLLLPGESTPRELHAEGAGESESLAFRFEDTGRAGIYTLDMRTQAGSSLREFFAVNVDPSEGDLRRADVSQLESILSDRPVDFVRPGEEAGLLALTDGEQSELWRTCLLLLVLFLLSEQLLAWYAAHHRRAVPVAGPAGRLP